MAKTNRGKQKLNRIGPKDAAERTGQVVSAMPIPTDNECLEIYEAAVAETGEEKLDFGSFLADLAAGKIPPRPEVTMPTASGEESEQRAGERFLLSRRVKRLEEKLATLRRNKASRSCPLHFYVILVKRGNPGRSSDHAFIARSVDSILEKNKKALFDACPKTWLEPNLPELPRLLSEARVHPYFKSKVKQLFSKAKP